MLKSQCNISLHRKACHGNEANLIVAVVVGMTIAFAYSRVDPATCRIVLVEDVVEFELFEDEVLLLELQLDDDDELEQLDICDFGVTSLGLCPVAFA